MFGVELKYSIVYLPNVIKKILFTDKMAEIDKYRYG
jgi:hypothetical protein